MYFPPEVLKISFFLSVIFKYLPREDLLSHYLISPEITRSNASRVEDVTTVVTIEIRAFSPPSLAFLFLSLQGAVCPR